MKCQLTELSQGALDAEDSGFCSIALTDCVRKKRLVRDEQAHLDNSSITPHLALLLVMLVT
ncbi:hypothetical protein [Bradyrhizobium zhanjiangense]|nr:hypothetical protein [Bradyrhizobium zhanjiangense]